jgi:4-amino-4-deoxy-L-arabinose transferase-like glycosyltransferase
MSAGTTTGVAGRLRSEPKAGSRAARPRGDVGWLWLAIFAFVAMTVWWLTQDSRVQDWDNGLHTLAAIDIHAEWARGNFFYWFNVFPPGGYPPFGHMVGALGVFLGGDHEASVILAENVVFVPMLALSCYGAGKIAYGTSRAGLLAAIFALGTPMIVSEFHEFLLDPQQAALVAASVWGLLACKRFERIGVAAAAGLAAGLAMMTKQTSIVFLAGVLIVVVARGGGWRSRRSFAGGVVYAAVFAIVAAPWYIHHYQEIKTLYQLNQSQAAVPGLPSRWSLPSLSWYVWDALNIQLLLPLTAFVAIGAVLALRDLWRTRWRWPDSVFPELLVGGLVSYLGCVWIIHKDPRYSLPALVYMAVLGGGWVAVASGWTRRIATVVLVCFALTNFVLVSTGSGPVVRFPVVPGAYAGPGVEAIMPRQATLLSSTGWLRSGPGSDGHIPSLMSGLKRIGITNVIFDAGTSNEEDFNTTGLQVLAYGAGLTPDAVYNPGTLAPHEAELIRHYQQPGEPPPCRLMEDGSGVYVIVGESALRPWENLEFACPGRRPVFYGGGVRSNAHPLASSTPQRPIPHSVR